MPSKLEALGILLLLLPGFLCALFLQAIAVRAKQSEFEKVVEALLFSSILYLVTAPLFHNTLPVRWISGQQPGYTNFTVQLNWPYLASLTAGALLLAVLYGASLNHDALHKLLRTLKLTERTSRLSVWNDTLQDIRSTFLLVELGDKRKVVGYLRYYSDDAEQASLFLEDAAWLSEDGVQVPIQGPGILLTKEAGILSISFLNPRVDEETAI